MAIGTLVKAAAVLKENGAKSVLALVTHGILSGNAIETLNGSVLEALVVTNTVPLGDKVERVRGRCFARIFDRANNRQCPKLRVIDISPTIAEAIRRTHNGTDQPIFPASHPLTFRLGESVSYLFTHAPV